MLVLLASVTLAAPNAFAQDAPPPAGEGQPEVREEQEGIRLIGKKKIKLLDWMELVAAASGIQFMISAQISSLLTNKEIEIISPIDPGTFIPREALFGVLQAMLKSENLILSPFGEDDPPNSIQFYEVVQITDAMTSSRVDDVLELDGFKNFKGSKLDEELKRKNAGFVTMIAKLKYADANQVRAALTQLATRRAGIINPIAGEVNALLIADYAFNVRRFAQLIDLMDRPAEKPRLEVINVRYLDAQELATAIQDLLQARDTVINQFGQPQPGGAGSNEDAVSITVAPNMNSMMVWGYDESIQLVKELVEKIDIKIPGYDYTERSGTTHIYKARNVQAVDLAATLNTLLGQGALPLGQPGQFPNFGQNTEENQPVIVEDENTNSLLIIAPSADYNTLLKILQQIDVRRPQVMIEAAILEVREDDDFTFGVELAGLEGSGSSPRLNFVTDFGFSTVVDSDGIPTGDGGGDPAGRSPIFGPGGILAVTNGGPFNIPLLLRFLKQQTEVNILSAPRVMANDNEESTIEILTEQPVLNTTTNNGVTSGNNTFTEDGITLTVTPQISQDKYIVLNLNLDVKAFIGQSAQPGLSPPRTSRTISTTVTVPDNQTVVIGGLTSTQASRSISKIPFLGDIPIVGELFKSEITSELKTNLYIFVRPQIYYDFEPIEEMSRESIAEVQELLLDSEIARKYFKEREKENKRSSSSREPGKIQRTLAVAPLARDD